MIKKEEYSKACKEVLEILKVVKEEDLNKIPKREIDALKENASIEYEFSYDSQKNIKEQNVSKLAKAIIANFFIDYIATSNQKQKILDKQKYDIKVLEEAKIKEYNPNEIFKNKKDGNNRTKNLNADLPIKIKKENFIIKLFRIIKKIFKRNN